MRILIVGLGAAGRRHARNLRALLGDTVELLALRRRGGGGIQEEGLGVTVFHDMESALGERPDGVIVADPTSMHLASASAAIEAGCALLIEKPLSHSWDGVDEFLSAASASSAPVLVGYQFRFHALLERVRGLVQDGAFGPVVSAVATYGEYLPDWHPYEDYRTGYAARRELGGGVVLTQIHDIDYLGWILGWPREVYSVGGHLSALEVDVDDTAVSLWPCLSGGRRVPVSLHQDYTHRPPVRRLEITMVGGVLHLDLLAPRLQAWDADARCVIDDSPVGYDRNDLFLAQMDHFLACMAGRETPRVPPMEAAKSLAVALAALRSQASGVVERVAYPKEVPSGANLP
jgi:predicted dehydrogenase